MSERLLRNAIADAQTALLGAHQFAYARMRPADRAAYQSYLSMGYHRLLCVTCDTQVVRIESALSDALDVERLERPLLRFDAPLTRGYAFNTDYDDAGINAYKVAAQALYLAIEATIARLGAGAREQLDAEANTPGARTCLVAEADAETLTCQTAMVDHRGLMWKNSFFEIRGPRDTNSAGPLEIYWREDLH